MNFKYFIHFFVLSFIFCSCSSEENLTTSNPSQMEEEEKEMNEVILPNIDLNNWKVTLPIGNPTEVEPPEILDYPNLDILKKYMYHDPKDQSIVFYTEPGSTTTNTKYSRTELREQMVPGSNNTNWTFDQGGTMSGKLKVNRVSGVAGKLDRIIIMQIHGRLTNEQRDLIGASDNNAPPVLKIYWDDNQINVRRKILKDTDVSDTDILKKDAWKDESKWFSKKVATNQFELSIKVSGSRMDITLDNEDTLTFDDIHTQKWGVFENYFKAGNYLQSTEAGTFSEVKYYELAVSH